MASNFDVAASITLKGEQEFRQSITSATSSLKEITSESKLVNEQFRGQQNTMEALRARHEVLAKSVVAHKEKEEALSKALDNAKKNQEDIWTSLQKLLGQWDEESPKLEELKKIYGESSDEVQEHYDCALEEVIDRPTDKKESAKTLRYLMMVLLNDEAEHSGKEGQKTYTEKEVGWLIMQDNVLEVTVAVLKAYGLFLPEPDEFASPNGEGGHGEKLPVLVRYLWC